MKIEDLGYSAFFEANRDKLGWADFSVARVLVEHKEAYKVRNADGEYLAKITGKQMFNAVSREDYPAVGDWVAIRELDSERAVIQGVLPRKTIIKRKYNNRNEIQVIAANVDVAFLVESVERDYNLNRLERYSAIANDGGVRPAIILNKTDLISRAELNAKLVQLKERFKGAGIFVSSAKTDEGLNELKKNIVGGKTYCFLGSSGVGKSSLINKLLGEDIIRTEDIGLGTGRGKHTTTSREMYFLETGGIVIDNPGMREVGVAAAGEGIESLFDDITALSHKCKYADCAHVGEPGCGVLSALKSGELNEGKYSNYIKLKKEAEYYEMNELEKREKDRRFGNFIKTAKKEIKKYKQ
ncbi:MAG: ribosome small subunit-dependent GTPase A [Candidatus Liptonbacteria bacterium]